MVRALLCLLVAWMPWATGLSGAEPFRLVSFNVENYLLEPIGTRVAKPAASRQRVQESIKALNPDILAVQEIGGEAALVELQSALEGAKVNLPHRELVTGYDTNIQIGILSRFPIVARRSHTNDSFLLQGRRYRTTRGFGEIDIQVTPAYQLTLFAAHLKSRRASADASESDIRLEEARLLRQRIDARLRANADANIALLGDLNDDKDSAPLRLLLGRGPTSLVDTRPAERNGDSPSASGGRRIAWTHFFAREDTYSRFDYILISRGLAKEWRPAGTYVLALGNWGEASDHRPVVAEFSPADQR